MKTLCLVFYTHQPIVLKNYRFYEIGTNSTYFSEMHNYANIEKLVKKKYRPLNAVLTKIFQEYGSKFKVSFSFSGVTLDLLEYAAPEVICDLKKLNEFGPIEFLSETYSHSVLSKKCHHEFMQQTIKQKDKVLQLFGQIPKAFMNNYGYPIKFLSNTLPQMGFKVVLQFKELQANPESQPTVQHYVTDTEVFHVLQSKKRILQPFIKASKKIDTDAFLQWVLSLPEDNEIVCLALDYLELAAQSDQDVQILEFIEELPEKAAALDINFSSPSELIHNSRQNHIKKNLISLETGQELESNVSNDLQIEILEILDGLKDKVYACNNEKIIKTWFYLQDQWLLNHLNLEDGVDAEKNQAIQHYINFRNVLQDFSQRVEQTLAQNKQELKQNFQNPLRPVKRQQPISSSEIFNTLF
ncbi:glycosyl hydrolase family 57 [Cecembia lonarensis]|uniref:Glycosyl hydrolase family 57 n=1 Tax=Cecembia lonarensis (strain CCUG 58316 / KCTC 22772 / LW9) TaxID=1225176 RepID=K1M2H2_CECL9|nr:glycosyl hydrolase family 57 [Cecembia lonarensis]EKB50499.1 Glycosyl hydrolase family 57 [Cecembia lonarensis LW9]